jgi:hypothetical protein
MSWHIIVRENDAMKASIFINDQLDILNANMVKMCHLYMAIKSNPERAEEVSEIRDKIIRLRSEISLLNRMKKTVLAFHNHVRGDDPA